MKSELNINKKKIENLHKAYFPYEKIFENNSNVVEQIPLEVFLTQKENWDNSYDYIPAFKPSNEEEFEKFRDSRRYSALKHLRNMRKRHFFHIVTPSPWPLYTSYTVIGFFIPFAWYLHHHVGMSREDMYGYFDARLIGYVCFAALAVLCYNLYCWFKDIIKESLNMHTFIIQHCMKQAFLFFIASEIMFFAAFFWAFFHSALSPVIWIGCLWPPVEIDTIDPWRVPALNTWILVFSGFTVTYAHKAVVERLKNHAYFAFIVTLFLAATFTRLQYWEYCKARFSLYDGIYGSCFYLLTGFHGFHVILGTLMLVICLIRYYYKDFSPQHHVGLVTAIWYWHFVDVVWIGLFLAVYWWGNYPFFDHKIMAKLLLWEKLLTPFNFTLVNTELFRDKKYLWLEAMMRYCFENSDYFQLKVNDKVNVLTENEKLIKQLEIEYNLVDETTYPELSAEEQEEFNEYLKGWIAENVSWKNEKLIKQLEIEYNLVDETTYPELSAEEQEEFNEYLKGWIAENVSWKNEKTK